jgi:hypothetical protein
MVKRFHNTMLTVNARRSPLMQNFHKPIDENAWWLFTARRYQAWLTAKPLDGGFEPLCGQSTAGVG